MVSRCNRVDRRSWVDRGGRGCAEPDQGAAQWLAAFLVAVRQIAAGLSVALPTLTLAP
jgi:hypothetical protein